MLSAKLNKNRTRINISLPVEPLRPSASGKTELLATSGGKVRTDVVLDDGRRVHVIANVFVFADRSNTANKTKKTDGGKS